MDNEMFFVPIFIKKNFEKLCGINYDEEDDKITSFKKFKKQDKSIAWIYLQSERYRVSSLYERAVIQRLFATGYFYYGLPKRLHILFLVLLI